MNNLESLQKVAEYLDLEFRLEEPWRSVAGTWSLTPNPFNCVLGEAAFFGEEVTPGRATLRFSRRLTLPELEEIERHRPIGVELIIEDNVVEPIAREKHFDCIGAAVSSFSLTGLTLVGGGQILLSNGQPLAISEVLFLSSSNQFIETEEGLLASNG